MTSAAEAPYNDQHNSSTPQPFDSNLSDSPVLYLAIALCLIAVCLGDIFTPLGIAVWVLYIIPLTLSLWLTRPSMPVYVALLATMLMIANFFADSPGGLDPTIAQTNRVMGAISLWVLATIGYFYIRNRNAVRREGWLRAGQQRINELLQGELQANELGAHVLAFLGDYVGAVAGAMFVKEGPDYNKAAMHGVSGDGVPNRFTVGEGLLGQVAKDGKTRVMRDVPDKYLHATCAFGNGQPRHLAMFATTADHVINGVIELGFMDEPSERTIELLERIDEAIGIALRSTNYRAHLQNLLEESQRQAEELQVQGEELKVSNEELEEQSRALQESQARMEQQQAELEQTNSQLEEQTQLLEAQRDDLHKAQEALEERSRELERASQYKSDFLANMSHELRTPLNSSLILAKLLADNPNGNLSPEQVMHAQTIQSAGNDLLNLINDILDLSKIEAGHMEIFAEPVRVASIVSDLERIFRPLAQTKNLQFACAIEPGTPHEIRTDAKRLEQVLKNLLSNAIKFTERGEVQLTIGSTPGGDVAFTVSDTGIGIAAEHQDVIFDAFRQADGTTNRKFGGTGLGLSISRELTRILGGEIQLASEPGKGSVFTVIVPETLDSGIVKSAAAPQPQMSRPLGQSALADRAPRPLPRKVPAAKQVNPDNIPTLRSTSIEDDRDRLSPRRQLLLVVEDDERFARILFDMAHEQNFQCIVSAQADEASELAERFLPAAVILDVGLPDHSGLSVLDRLKQNPRTRHIPVHVISAEDYAETAYSLGAVSYTLKPVMREELLTTFQQLERRTTQRMRRLLIVEDDQVQRESIEKLLAAPDVTIVGAGSVAECLQLLKNETFDCMVLDISLPDESGYTLLETLSKEDSYSFPPVIVYTGRDLSSAQEQQLRRYSKSIIIKGAKSPERLLDEVTLFLHQVVNELPAEQQSMLKKARNRDAILEGRRILVVEDDIRNIYSISNILEPRGAVVQIARNGKEALVALEQSRASDDKTIDLVLMDVMMPEMDGITATRHIRAQGEWRKLPIIMLTAKAMRDDQEQCLAAGANDYMAKPLDVDKLLSLVRVWMPR
jgi:signal transduction histidine kinase/CheY-like chemotaxis protein